MISHHHCLQTQKPSPCGWRAGILALHLLLVVHVSGAVGMDANDESVASRPNIILMMADDLGWGDTGYNGHPDLKTPHLDTMAKAGLRMDRFYAGSPVCSPTRGSCLTGRHPFRYGIFFANTGHLRSGEWTLAELLRQQGYATGHFGKWHLGTLTKNEKDSNRGGPRGKKHYSPPWENGFDESFSTEARVPTWDPMRRPRGDKIPAWWDPIDDDENAAPFGTAYWANGVKVTEPLRGDDSRIIMDRATAFIRDASRRRQSFFTVIWFHAPHLPVVAGPEYTKQYASFDKFHQHYYGCITALDEQVGRLRRELREIGVAKNTLLFFCSDNGPERNSNGPGSAGPLRGSKRSLFEGGIRVPGIVEWPAQIEPGRITDLPVSTSDYLPTILEVLDIDLPDTRPCDGMSLLSLFRGELQQRPRPIAFESKGQLALVDNRYKIVRPPPKKTKGPRESRPDHTEPISQSDFMLFDLIEDPRETTNLADRHSEIVQQMTETLDRWRSSCQKSLAGEDYRSEQGENQP